MEIPNSTIKVFLIIVVKIDFGSDKSSVTLKSIDGKIKI